MENRNLKIAVNSVSLFHNFGGPSLVGGLDEILSKVFPDCEAVVFDHLISNKIHLTENKVICTAIPKLKVNRIHFIVNALLYRLLRFTIFRRDAVFNALLEANIYIDAEGIKYSDKLTKGKDGLLSTFLPSLEVLPITAKILGLRLISYTKSYGPVIRKQTKSNISFYSKHIFELLYCREQLSSQVLLNHGVPSEKIITTFDSGVMFMSKTSERIPKYSEKYVIISVSFQVIKQWNNKTSYFDFMKLIVHRFTLYSNMRVVLFPNEFKEGSYDDLNVAIDIKSFFAENDKVEVFDLRIFTPMEAKCFIANSELMVGSRYHAVVAALSSGVPSLVIGWHHKYQEIMKAYGMSEFISDNESCSENWLIDKMEILLSNNKLYRDIILEHHMQVSEDVLNAGMSMRKMKQ